MTMNGVAAPEQLEPDVLVARAALACATYDLCVAYFDLHQRCWDADSRGAALEAEARGSLVGEICGAEIAAFATAWQRGQSFDENTKAAELAARRFAALFNEDEQIRQGV